MSASADARIRRAFVVSGVVQGVGFRPYVYRLACELALGGYVRNRTGEVFIEVEGPKVAVERFGARLVVEAPSPAAIAAQQSFELPLVHDTRFRIAESDCDSGFAVIAPDLATCEPCLRELFDPDDRRHQYPFLNCSQCGPRLTVVTDVPYDRARTTMALFTMCPACRGEYQDAADRRFHAEPIACPICGPRLRLLDANGAELAAKDPIAVVGAALEQGLIVAVKGIGGYHLVCDARREAAVARLRRRKERDAKPFAVMVADVGAAAVLSHVSAVERELLGSSARPIVLLRSRPDAHLAPSIAPRSDLLGVMIAYSPLHHLLLRRAGGPLVVTSGNRSNEPIAISDSDAAARLGGVCDLFLAHDRPIYLRCEDSVARVLGGAPTILRRARGFAPLPLPLPLPLMRPTLAVGGQGKSTFALGRTAEAILSPHLGDLHHHQAYRAFVDTIDHYRRLHHFEYGRIVHDLHPDYASTLWAREQSGCDLVGVQHHRAHLASCMAENGVTGSTIGVIFDGTGWGDDGAVWGGEFLVGDLRSMRRAAHLDYVMLPGGDQAVREPWRMAVSHLVAAGRDPTLALKAASSASSIPIDPTSLRAVVRLAEPATSRLRTSSMGRLFDAVSALVGLGARVTFEGEAAMQLEGAAASCAADGEYPYELASLLGRGVVDAESAFGIDVRPTISAVADDVVRGVAAAVIARRFHSTMVSLITTVCERLRSETAIGTVALSGGVFMNAILSGEAATRLSRIGFRVLVHRQVPPGDGGLSYGQLALAAALDERS